MEHRSRNGYSDKERENAVALYQKCGSIRAVSIKTGVARSTLRMWIHKSGLSEKEPKEKAQRDKKTVEKSASNSLTMRRKDEDGEILHCARVTMADALHLLQRQVQTALRSQYELDAFLLALRNADDVPQKERMETAKAIAKMGQPDIRDLMNAINAMYEQMTNIQAAEEKEKVDLSGLSTKEIRAILGANGCD